MPTKKISSDVKPCLDPDHNPPTHMFYEHGGHYFPSDSPYIENLGELISTIRDEKIQ